MSLPVINVIYETLSAERTHFFIKYEITVETIWRYSTISVGVGADFSSMRVLSEYHSSPYELDDDNLVF